MNPLEGSRYPTLRCKDESTASNSIVIIITAPRQIDRVIYKPSKVLSTWVSPLIVKSYTDLVVCRKRHRTTSAEISIYRYMHKVHLYNISLSLSLSSACLNPSDVGLLQMTSFNTVPCDLYPFPPRHPSDVIVQTHLGTSGRYSKCLPTNQSCVPYDQPTLI